MRLYAAWAERQIKLRTCLSDKKRLVYRLAWGERVFFCLARQYLRHNRQNKTGCRTDAVYTDFGLGLGTHSYDELGFLDEEIGTEFPFFEYLNSTYFVGDLESVYRIYK